MTPSMPAYSVRIISGGQTGVDRAALDAAIEAGLPIGGWCPLGRRAEDGAIPDRYPMQETPTDDYPQRTKWNVRDSDVTLIVTRGDPDGGTALTLRYAKAIGKSVRVIDLESPPFVPMVRDWLQELQPEIINVAGPRETSRPGIYAAAKAYLAQLFAPLDEAP